MRFGRQASSWRERLLVFTGFYLLTGIWTPLMWFVYDARQTFHMESFDIFLMPPRAVIFFIGLSILTIIAQFGFAIIATDFDKAAAGNGSRHE